MELKAVYTWRAPVAALPVIFSIFCFAGECENDLVIWPLGVLLFVAGWALRTWAQKHLGYRLKIKRTITISGPYTLVVTWQAGHWLNATAFLSVMAPRR